MGNDIPLVSRFEHSILVPLRLIGPNGNERSDEHALRDLLLASGDWEEVRSVTSEAGEGGESADAACGSWAARRDHQAYVYFHPFVRRFLFDAQTVIRLNRKGVRKLHFTPGTWKRGKPSREFSVESCSLWLFSGARIGILRLDLRAVIEKDSGLTLSEVQFAIDQLRRLYPPYFDDCEGGSLRGGHCPEKVVLEFDDGAKVESDYAADSRYLREGRQWQKSSLAHAGGFPWAKHWEALFGSLAGPPPVQTAETDREASPWWAGAGRNAQHPAGGVSAGEAASWRAVALGDDRAACMSFLGFRHQGALRSVDRGNWVRLCFGDAPGSDELPYQRRFLASFERRYCYDRFWYEVGESSHAPSRIMNCGYAFTWAGSDDDRIYFANEKNGAVATFRHIYVPMGVVAQFQQSALLGISHELSVLNDAKSGDAKERRVGLKQLYRRFIDFTQRYWFDEVSPQIQGKELFEMWRRELRIQELFDEVRQELRDMTQEQDAAWQQSQTEQQKKQTEAAATLTATALVFAVLGILIAAASMGSGLFGMNTFDLANVSIDPPDYSKFGTRLLVFAVPILLALSIAVCVWLVWLVWRRRDVFKAVLSASPKED